MDRKLRSEVRDTQKMVKEAAVSLQKAADKAAKIAKATREELRRSKEVHEASAKAGEALKAIGAAAKAATTVIAAGASGLGQTREVKKAQSKAAEAARSAAEVAKTATKVAGETVRTTARRKAAEVKEEDIERLLAFVGACMLRGGLPDLDAISFPA